MYDFFAKQGVKKKEKKSKHEMCKEKQLKVQGEVANIKGEGGGGGGGDSSGGDTEGFRLPWLSFDLMKWKGGAAKRRAKQDGVYTSAENALAK